MSRQMVAGAFLAAGALVASCGSASPAGGNDPAQSLVAESTFSPVTSVGQKPIGDLEFTYEGEIAAPDVPNGLDWFNVERPLHLATDLRGKIIILDFWTQGCINCLHVISDLHRLEEEGRIPVLPVYLDSPLAIAVTDVFRLHPECFDEALSDMIRDRRVPFVTRELVRVRSREESMAVMAREEAAVIIAGSGMCENGRIVHHLAHGIGSVENTVLLVGFQAENTLGRRLKEGASSVKIFGDMLPVRARVRSLEGFSAHADSEDLMAYVELLAGRHHLKNVFLVHGEKQAADALAAGLRERKVAADLHVAAPGESFPLPAN